VSTLKLENIKHENSSTNNMVMDSDGNVNITNGLTVDTDTLYVDKANDRVGINTLTPDYDLTIEGSGHPRVRINSTDNTASGVFMHVSNGGSQTGTATIRVDGSGNYSVYNGTSSSPLTMNIDGSGRMTVPYQPSFGAYQASANYLVANGYHKMVIDGTRWNEGNHYDTSNSKFVAPVSGVYHFSAHVNRYSVADDYFFTIQFYVNGSSHTMGSRLYSRGGADLVASMSHTIKLTANDYVEVYSYSNDTSSGFSAGATWNTFSGFLVG